jgi:hypothetical protein
LFRELRVNADLGVARGSSDAKFLPQSACRLATMPKSRLIKLNAPIVKPLARKRDKREDAVQVIMRRCTRCRGTGQAVCQICSGAGAVMTGRDVFGRLQQTRCAGCFGTKCTRCVTCAGTGWV